MEESLPFAPDMMDAFGIMLANGQIAAYLPRTTISELFDTQRHKYTSADAIMNPSRTTFNTNIGSVTLKDGEILPFTRGVNFFPIIDKIGESDLEVTPLVLLEPYRSEVADVCDWYGCKGDFQFKTLRELLDNR